MPKVAVDTLFMRGINARAVLGVVRDEQSLSVSELSARTGLSRQAITRALSWLESRGLVRFRPPDHNAARAGRPAQSVEFRSRAGYVLGASMTPTSVAVTLADLRGTFIARHEAELSAGTAASDVLKSAAQAAMKAAGVGVGQVWAACVGVPGIVDVETGEVRLSLSMSSLNGTLVAERLAAYLGAPVTTDNYVKLATEGEQWRGTARALSSLVFVEWGERVGLGLLLNNTLYRGASNDSGDLGFLDLSIGADRDVEPPDDGLGPFERLVGESALVASARTHAVALGDRGLIAVLDDPRSSGLEAVIDAVLAEQPAAIAALREVVRVFARGLSTVRALLDPQLVIIGGPMARAGDRLLAEIAAALSGQILNQPPLELSTLGRDAVLFGAVHNALASVETGRLSAESLARTVSSPAG